MNTYSLKSIIFREKSPVPDPQDKLFNSRDLILFQQVLMKFMIYKYIHNVFFCYR